MAVRDFRYATEAGIADLTASFFDSQDNLVLSTAMIETQNIGVYKASVNVIQSMNYGVITSPSFNIQFIFKLPFNESSIEISNAVTSSLEFISLSANVDLIKNYNDGRWQIINNQMIFFKSDNLTEIARFDLKDGNNIATEVNVMQRIKV